MSSIVQLEINCQQDKHDPWAHKVLNRCTNEHSDNLFILLCVSTYISLLRYMGGYRVQHMTECSFCYRKFHLWFPQTMVRSPPWQLGSKWPLYQRNWVADHLGLLNYVFSYKLTSSSGFPTALQYGIKCWYYIRLWKFLTVVHIHTLYSPNVLFIPIAYYLFLSSTKYAKTYF